MASNTYLDDTPRSLHSYLHTEDIAIQRSDELSFTSQSNHLQISQSPPRDFITKSTSRYNSPDKQADYVDANCQTENLLCTSVSHVKGPFSDTKGEDICVQLPKQSQTERKMFVSKEKYNHEQANGKESTKDRNILPVPPSCPVPVQNNPVYNSFPVHLTAGPIPSPVIDIPSDCIFYSFVILHDPEDQEEAIRICQVLQEIVIGEGTTFCEGFETPGVSPLSSLDEAVENSAYVVLLLTNNFFSRMGEIQTCAVLMNSIDDHNKSGSVIPFIPTLNGCINMKSLCLKSLSQLKEDSPNFRQKVIKTFKENIIKKEHEKWRRKQHAKLLEKQTQQRQNVSLEYNIMRNQLCPEMPTLHIDHLQSLLMHGQPLAIHINNAENVQIGNQNIMNVNPGNKSDTDLIVHDDL